MATVATAVGAMAGMAQKRDLYFGRTTILPLAVSRRVDVGFGSDDQNGQRAIQTFRSVGQTDRQTDDEWAQPMPILHGVRDFIYEYLDIFETAMDDINYRLKEK